METLDSTVRLAHDWALDRINSMSKDVESIQDAYSILRELEEWIEPDTESHEIFSLEYIGEDSDYQ